MWSAIGRSAHKAYSFCSPPAGAAGVTAAGRHAMWGEAGYVLQRRRPGMRPPLNCRGLAVSWMSGRPKQVNAKDDPRKRKSTQEKLVIGCGAAVLEHVHVLTSIPQPGEDVYLSSVQPDASAGAAAASEPGSLGPDSFVSGATLASLAWASAMYVPTAFLGFLGLGALSCFFCKARNCIVL
jgi:hypothetical protein